MSNERATIWSLRCQSSRHFTTASACEAPVPEVSLGTPRSYPVLAPETKNGSLSICFFVVMSVINFPSQCTVSGAVASNSNFRFSTALDLCITLASCIELRLILMSEILYPKLVAISLRTYVAFLDDVFVLPKAAVSSGVVTFFVALFRIEILTWLTVGSLSDSEVVSDSSDVKSNAVWLQLASSSSVRNFCRFTFACQRFCFRFIFPTYTLSTRPIAPGRPYFLCVKRKA